MTTLHMIMLLLAAGATEGLASIPAGVYALAGTVVGTIGLRLLEKWLSRNKDKSEVRRDLHNEIKDLTDRLDRVEREVSDWRTRAYAAEEQVALLRVMVIQLGGQLPESAVNKQFGDAAK